MANVAGGNMIFVDTVGYDISIDNIRVYGVVVTCTDPSNDAVVTLANKDANADYDTLLSLKVDNDDKTKKFSFDGRPIVFPNGIRVTAVTDANITIIYERASGVQ